MNNNNDINYSQPQQPSSSEEGRGSSECAFPNSSSSDSISNTEFIELSAQKQEELEMTTNTTTNDDETNNQQHSNKMNETPETPTSNQQQQLSVASEELSEQQTVTVTIEEAEEELSSSSSTLLETIQQQQQESILNNNRRNTINFLPPPTHFVHKRGSQELPELVSPYRRIATTNNLKATTTTTALNPTTTTTATTTATATTTHSGHSQHSNSSGSLSNLLKLNSSSTQLLVNNNDNSSNGSGGIASSVSANEILPTRRNQRLGKSLQIITSPLPSPPQSSSSSATTQQSSPPQQQQAPSSPSPTQNTNNNNNNSESFAMYKYALENDDFSQIDFGLEVNSAQTSASEITFPVSNKANAFYGNAHGNSGNGNYFFNGQPNTASVDETAIMRKNSVIDDSNSDSGGDQLLEITKHYELYLICIGDLDNCLVQKMLKTVGGQMYISNRQVSFILRNTNEKVTFTFNFYSQFNWYLMDFLKDEAKDCHGLLFTFNITHSEGWNELKQTISKKYVDVQDFVRPSIVLGTYSHSNRMPSVVNTSQVISVVDKWKEKQIISYLEIDVEDKDECKMALTHLATAIIQNMKDKQKLSSRSRGMRGNPLFSKICGSVSGD